MNPAGVSTTVFRIYGVVQGVGFRPFVSRIAVRAGLTGSVANRGSYVNGIFLFTVRSQFILWFPLCLFFTTKTKRD